MYLDTMKSALAQDKIMTKGKKGAEDADAAPMVALAAAKAACVCAAAVAAA